MKIAVWFLASITLLSSINRAPAAQTTRASRVKVNTISTEPGLVIAKLRPGEGQEFEVRGNAVFTLIEANSDGTMTGILVYEFNAEARRKMAETTRKPLAEIPANSTINNVIANFERNPVCPDIRLEFSPFETRVGGITLRSEKFILNLRESSGVLSKIICRWARTISSGRSHPPIRAINAVLRVLKDDPAADVDDHAFLVGLLKNNADTEAAFAHIDQNRDAILQEWITLTEINAPSYKEKERAAYVEKLLRQAKLEDIHYDSIGNLIAVRKGTGGGPTIVVDAHLDTVFQEGLKIKATIKEGRIHAPGVGDDTRNVEAILAMIRAMDHAKIKTRGDLIFVFTVQEEVGLRGAEHFIRENRGRIDYYVALDGGMGTGYEGFTYGGLGIHQYRHHLIGPGGHSRQPPPPFSATLPAARAIARIYGLPLPANPPTYVNIGMLGGAEVVNAKAADAWFTVDLRSTDQRVIDDLEKKIAAIIEEEAGRVGMTVKTEVLGADRAVQLPGHRESPMVRMIEAVHIAMGFAKPNISAIGSNNSAAALRAGIPAISTGAAPCQNAHALTEWCEIEPLYHGIKKVLLMTLALDQLSAR